MARRDVAPLAARQREFLGRAALTLGGVVNHHGGGVHSGQRVHAALTRRVEPRAAQLQLVVAGQLNERTPTERSLEARSEPGGHTRRDGERF